MSDLAVPEPDVLVLPHTGEVVRYDDPAGCAGALDEIRDLEWRLRQAKQALTLALEAESARQGSRTLRFGTLEVVLSSGEKTEWDVTELVKLLDVGLPADRYDALVREEVTYRVNAAEARRIASANPEYAAVIERARTIVPCPAYAKVSRG